MSRISFGLCSGLPRRGAETRAGSFDDYGTVTAIEIAAEDAGYSSSLKPWLYRFFLEKGILLRPLGNVVYVVPPYAIKAGDLHGIWDAIGEAVDLNQRTAV